MRDSCYWMLTHFIATQPFIKAISEVGSRKIDTYILMGHAITLTSQWGDMNEGRWTNINNNSLTLLIIISPEMTTECLFIGVKLIQAPDMRSGDECMLEGVGIEIGWLNPLATPHLHLHICRSVGILVSKTTPVSANQKGVHHLGVNANKEIHHYFWTTSKCILSERFSEN